MKRILRVIPVLLIAACASAPPQETQRWWKGNLHTHSLWSDGADFPELIAAWYRDHGYNFLGISEHDMLQEGERWVDINAKDAGWPPRNESTRLALPVYRERLGNAWVQERTDSTRHLVRLRSLSEYRHMFEQKDQFLFLLGEEITDRQGAHVNAYNLAEAIKPRGGATTAERISNNLSAVAEQRRATGRPIVAIVNHPNFLWALNADGIAAIPEARLFEVYNGHRTTNNAGDSAHLSTEQMWDVMLTSRHKAGAQPIYGIATDDAHDYRAYGDTVSRPGRGWVMVRAPQLTPHNLAAALHAGDFYASTGVTLKDVRNDGRALHVKIDARPGVTYRTLFIGTRRNSDGLGEVLEQVEGANASYRFRGDERYVRAKVVSSLPQLDPIGGQVLGVQVAFIQPIFF